MELLSLCMSPHWVDCSFVGDPVGFESVIYCLYRFVLISGAGCFVTGVTAASRYVLFTRFLKFSSLLILVVSLRLYDRFGPSGKLSARLIVRCTASPREFTS